MVSCHATMQCYVYGIADVWTSAVMLCKYCYITNSSNSRCMDTGQ